MGVMLDAVCRCRCRCYWYYLLPIVAVNVTVGNFPIRSCIVAHKSSFTVGEYLLPSMDSRTVGKGAVTGLELL